MAKYKLTGNPELIYDQENERGIPKGHMWWKEYEEWAAAGNTPDPVFTFPELKQNHLNTIKQSFVEEPEKGLTTSLGLKVDCTRADKDNFQELLNYCQRKNLQSITIRLFDNGFAEVTTAELQTVINEIQEHGLNLYQRKWTKETAIEQAATEEELQAITWDSVE